MAAARNRRSRRGLLERGPFLMLRRASPLDPIPSEFAGKLAVTLLGVLFSAPGSNLLEVDCVSTGNLNRGTQALSVAPVVEGSEPVAARVCGGECPNPFLSRFQPLPNWLDGEITSDPEWAGRELHEEWSARMKVKITASPESGFRHRVVQSLLSRSRLEDVIQVLRLILARSVNRCAGAAGQYGADSGVFQCIGNRTCDLINPGFRR